MAFECQCCSTMGEIISIREQIQPFEFRIAYTTGEKRVVSVDPDKRDPDLFGFAQNKERRSLACPFLMRRSAHRHICIVHASRPEICRNYLCSRILILNKDGTRAGRVLPGTRLLTTTDRIVLGLWQSCLRDLPVPDEEAWERLVERSFTRAGYRVIR